MRLSTLRSNNTHVAFFLPDLGGGGAERVVVTLANAYAERGLQVDLVLGKGLGPYAALVSPHVNLVQLGASRLLNSVPRLASYLRRTRPSVLLSTIYHANVGALIAKRLSRVETYVVIREASTVTYSTKDVERLALKVAGALIPYVYPWADEIVAVSHGAARHLAQLINLPEERVQVIYNPVITPELELLASKPVTHPWFVSDQTPIILGVGRLTRAKNFSNLIEAFRLVRQRCDARLIILGEGNERHSLEQAVREMNLSEYVDLPGFVENPFAYMKRATVFALSSDWEGLPNALIQAMACGCNVVATDCPSGPREILADGKYGHLVPPDNANALAAAIEEVLSGDGKKVDPSWLQQFSLERILNEYQKVMQI